MVAPGAGPKGGEGPAGSLLPRGLRSPAQGPLEGRGLGPEPSEGRGLIRGGVYLQELGLGRGGTNTRKRRCEAYGVFLSVRTLRSSPGFAPPCRGYAHIPPSSPMTSRPRYQGTS